MQDIRIAIEELTNEVMGLRYENNSLKLECIKLVESSKIQRSDKLLTAEELKKDKFNGIGDGTFAKVLKDPLFVECAQVILYEGARARYSCKGTDNYFRQKLKTK